MKRHSFPLAGLHRWRAHAERAARRNLGSALAELGRLEHQLVVVLESVTSCSDEEHGAARPLAVAMRGGLLRLEAQLQLTVSQATTLVEQARQQYQVRRKDLRVLSKLAERKEEEWRAEVLAEDQRDTDEMMRMRAHWRRP